MRPVDEVRSPPPPEARVSSPRPFPCVADESTRLGVGGGGNNGATQREVGEGSCTVRAAAITIPRGWWGVGGAMENTWPPQSPSSLCPRS